MQIGVKSTDTITFIPSLEKDTDPEIIAVMSMAVNLVEQYYETLYRQVQKTQKQEVPESVIAFASSENGVDFQRSGLIPVRPTKEIGSHDILAVEDPTVVKVDGQYFVFHSAVEPKPSGDPGVQVSLQVVSGASLQTLSPDKKLILTPQDVAKTLGEGVDMVKEPEFFFNNGMWYMIYEHTGRGKSEIAIAESPSLTGPYRDHRSLLQTREGMWDSQHTSPGPILLTSRGDILMLYNGRGPKNAEDQTPSWAIGFVIIDAKTGAILTRSDAPIITPPSEIGPGNQLIAFANSVVEDSGENRLYYTIADSRMAVANLDVAGL